MKNFKIKTFLLTLILSVFWLFKPVTVSASGLCGIFPCELASPCLGTDCGSNSLTVVGTVLQFSLSFIFVGILIYGIWLIIQAAVKIIRSNGDESQIESGTKMIKGAYIGLTMIFVGLIGLVIVFVIFNATDIFKVNPSDPPGINLS